MTIQQSVDIAEIARRSSSITQPIGTARHLPGELYASEEIFDLEVKNIFKREWLMVMREEEIAKPGDYKVLSLFGDSILICRDKAGQVHAFRNSCRHRGVEVAFGSGNRKTFMCPYHGWIYSLDGKLIEAQYMDNTSGFDASSCRLPLVQCDTWGGFIFINFDLNAASLQTEMGHLLSRLDHLRPQDCRVVDTMDVLADCNWKLQIENLVDIYHVGTLHADTIGENFDPTKTNIALLDGGAVSMKTYLPTLTPDGQTRFATMPWLDPQTAMFADLVSLPPTSFIISRFDLILAFTAIPLAANKTHWIMHILMPEAVLSDPDFQAKIKVYRDYTRAVYAEDSPMLDSIQKNFMTEAYEPGYLNPLEDGIQHYLKGHLTRLFEPEGIAI